MGKGFTQDCRAFILAVTFNADNCLHHVLLPVVEERGGGGSGKGGGGDQLDRCNFLCIIVWNCIAITFLH